MSSDHRMPRTVQDAFGPYTSREVFPMPDTHGSRTERMAGVVLAIVIGIIGAMLLAHWAAS